MLEVPELCFVVVTPAHLQLQLQFGLLDIGLTPAPNALNPPRSWPSEFASKAGISKPMEASKDIDLIILDKNLILTIKKARRLSDRMHIYLNKKHSFLL